VARFLAIARWLAAGIVLVVCVTDLASQPDGDRAATPVGGERLDTMHIELKTEGGVAYFPGLAAPTVIDTAQLPESEARELEKLVEAARFFDRTVGEPAPTRGAADYRTYSITIEKGGRRHTLRTTDVTSDPGLKALVAFLRAKEREVRSKARETPTR
jgi:hypothetical protein